jgi:hypothetical protein
MDEQRHTLNLAPPFEDVRLEVAISDCRIQLLYIGTAERLFECGAVEPRMVEPGTAKERPRVDSSGFHFMRDVQWSKGTRLLRIARYITDLTFAAQLPGAPQALTFPGLDWLDAHPGRVRVDVNDEVYGNRRYTKRVTAGTVEALIKMGFPAKVFDLKWSVARVMQHNWLQRTPELRLQGYVTTRRLMRGYFELEQTWTRAASTIQKCPSRARAPALDRQPAARVGQPRKRINVATRCSRPGRLRPYTDAARFAPVLHACRSPHT